MNVDIIPIGNNLSVRESVYQERKDFKSFLVNEMVNYCTNLLGKAISGNFQEEDLYRVFIFKNKLKLHFVMTTNNTVYFQTHDTIPFSLRNHMRINEEGVADFLEKFINSYDKKFKALNKETLTEKTFFY